MGITSNAVTFLVAVVLCTSFPSWLHFVNMADNQDLLRRVPELVGTWNLVRHHAWLPHDPTNRTTPMGTGAEAIIIYAPDGYMSAQFSISPESDSAQDSELSAGAGAGGSQAAKTFMAYSGEYSIEKSEEQDKVIVTHYARITNVPGLQGVTQKRFFKVIDGPDGRRHLTLTSVAPLRFNGEERFIEVTLAQFPPNLE